MNDRGIVIAMRFRRALALSISFAASSTASCTFQPPPLAPAPSAELPSPFTGFRSVHYGDPKSWLCLPGRDGDPCAGSLDTTELRPDGTRAIHRAEPSKKLADVDCFYVYPTVDLSLSADNHTSFDDLSAMARATIAQAAHFGEVCNLYVPLYRQATIGAYLRKPEVREQYLAVAASDVLDAFLHYMGQYNQGHRIVLIGHSQGAEMITRVLKRFFDDDPLMRDRLLVAMPIGGGVYVPPGQRVGGTFEHLPVCSSKDETACVIAYRSYVGGAEVPLGHWAPPPGLESACVNPAELLRGVDAPFSDGIFPLGNLARPFLRGIDDVTTPFVGVPDFYSGHCLPGPSGSTHLEVFATPRPNDLRQSLVNLDSGKLHGELGLHVLDFQFSQGDLVELVERRAKSYETTPR